MARECQGRGGPSRSPRRQERGRPSGPDAGRDGRAIVDLVLAQDVDSPHRFHSLSRQLMAQREAYYDALARAQCGTPDVTAWVVWFVEQFRLACLTSQQIISMAIEKSRFWATHAQHPVNTRQRKALMHLLEAGRDGFQGGMSAEKYGNLTGASKATAKAAATIAAEGTSITARSILTGIRTRGTANDHRTGDLAGRPGRRSPGSGAAYAESLERLLQEALRRREAANRLLDVADRVARAGIAPMSMEEINAEVRAYRDERRRREAGR